MTPAGIQVPPCSAPKKRLLEWSRTNANLALQPGQWSHAELHAASLDVPAPITDSRGPRSSAHRWQRATNGRSRDRPVCARKKHRPRRNRRDDADDRGGLPHGRRGGPRHADAVALGEADETWPRIVEDAARGQLKDVYAPADAFGQERK